MDLEVFSKSPSGKLLKCGRGVAAHWAFVPHPLPPALRLDWGLAGSLAKAERALGELVGLARMLPNPHMLVRPFIRHEAVASSRIEGTESDLTDLYLYEAGQLRRGAPKPTVPEEDVREVLNCVHALEYGLTRLETLPVSLRLMRELHERLMAGVRGAQRAPGEFRRTQNWIGPPGSTIATATYVPPPVPEMTLGLDALERYLHRDDALPALVRLALIHYQFEALHPFVDGNGRIGRLILVLLLVHWGLLPIPLLYLSPFFERYRSQYYDLLLGVSARGAWEEWIAFFLQAVTTQSLDAVARAKKLQDLQAEWRERLADRRTPALLLRLADRLFESPTLTIRDAQDLLGVAYHTAEKYVARLVRDGLLRPMGEKAFGRLYVADAILDAVQPTEDRSGQIAF